MATYNAQVLTRWFCLAVLVSALYPALAGESRAMTVGPSGLLSVAYPGCKPNPGSAAKEAELCNIELPSAPKWSPTLLTEDATSGVVSSGSQALVEPLDVIRLDETHAVLMTQATPTQDGKVVCGYECSYFIGAAFFQHEASGWRLSKRVNAIAWHSYSGEVRAERWPGVGVLFSQIDGGCWQGDCTSSVIMLGLQPDKVMPLLQTSIAADNEGAGIDITDSDKYSDLGCGDLLSPHFRPPADLQLNDSETECLDFKGSWKFEGNRIEFTFRRVSRTVSGGKLHPLVRSISHATLELSGGKLKLISGQLPQVGF
jgi:hypothetical protein